MPKRYTTAAGDADLDDPLEVPDPDAPLEPHGCGMCLMAHISLRLVLSYVWYVTVPFKFLETLAVVTPVWYIQRLLKRRAALLAATFLVGAALGYGLFMPLAKTANYGGTCTAYLSLLSWNVGHLAVFILAAAQAVPLMALTEGPCGYCRRSMDTRRCKWLMTLGEAGYLGMVAGLCIVFGDVAFDPNQPSGQWHWCRTSDIWPAEAIYIPIFTFAMASALVQLRSLEEDEESNATPYRIRPGGSVFNHTGDSVVTVNTEPRA